MRYFEFTIKPDDGAIHPVDSVIIETPGVTREALVHVNALANGTGVMLYRLRGDPERLQTRLDGHPELLSCSSIAVEGETFHFYVHVKPGQPAGRLMSVAQKYALMIVPPLAFVEGGLRITVVGTHEMLQQALEELPEETRITVEQVGEYSPDERNVLSLLTDRQLEVFETAVENGYYEVPRQATHEDIAGTLDCAPSTVDEHLRKAESRILTSLV
ncbi:helix-turn-helix domain-containing protein [Halococcus thailandensis]|uniref:DNA binding protein n=1 Tax=Halococcus thailandensis JCM 13552 TaxID=1227457 RepID=M0N480_9EURY|nr:helix-turn-helix domain-containing protein [Halococcus thailandensis]EMA51914.1 DNA binding protein [Halococcus thailandensis JCM 13552]